MTFQVGDRVIVKKRWSFGSDYATIRWIMRDGSYLLRWDVGYQPAGHMPQGSFHDCDLLKVIE